MKKIVLLTLCVCLLLGLTGCGKVTLADAFSQTGLNPPDSGLLLDSSSKEIKTTQKSKELFPDFYDRLVQYRFLYDTEADRDAALTSYCEYLESQGLTTLEKSTDKNLLYGPENHKYELQIDRVGPLSGDYEKMGHGGKYAIFIGIAFYD